MPSETRPEVVLLTGATGYVGGRLLSALQHRDVAVRCMARRPEALQAKIGAGVEVVYGDVMQPEPLERALVGVTTAYYLVHSMGSPGAFEEADRLGARNFAAAARNAGVQRLIYLGGLGTADSTLSPHLRSRHEVGDTLRTSSVPVIEFRASIVIGSGSTSFEMIRALTERLPVMITPRWVATLAQPIFIGDVIAYLLAALDAPKGTSAIYEIGGADRASYGAIMREYARQRRLRRVMISVPVLTPRLSSLWLGLVTPVYARIGRALVNSLRNPTVVEDHAALLAFLVRPVGLQDAIAAALRNEDQQYAQTMWTDALSSSGASRVLTGASFGRRIVNSRAVRVPVGPAVAFAPVRRIGGASGWYFGNPLWRIRGWLDLLVGGVGLRRGRRDPETPMVGDALDFWRVEAYEPDRLLRLFAEMKLPGRAWLQFEVTGSAAGSTIRQTAAYDPVGLMGLVYWYVLLPVHVWIFGGMLRRIAAMAVEAGDRE